MSPKKKLTHIDTSDLLRINYENNTNNIRFIIINIRCYWDFRSDIADDAAIASCSLVFFQKLQDFIREAHQQQALRFVYKKLQRE